MRKSKFTESQIVGILKEAESGVPVSDLLRQHGISKTTFFKWRSKYAGASVADVKRLRELEGENAKLKRMYADLALENAAIKDVHNPSSPAYVTMDAQVRTGLLERYAPNVRQLEGCWDATLHHCGGNAGGFTRTLTPRAATASKAGRTPRSFDRHRSARRTRPARERAWRHAAP